MYITCTYTFALVQVTFATMRILRRSERLREQFKTKSTAANTRAYEPSEPYEPSESEPASYEPTSPSYEPPYDPDEPPYARAHPSYDRD